MLVNLYLNKTKKNCQRKVVGNSRIFCRFGKNDLKEVAKATSTIVQQQNHKGGLPPVESPSSNYQDSMENSRRHFKGIIENTSTSSSSSSSSSYSTKKAVDTFNANRRFTYLTRPLEMNYQQKRHASSSQMQSLTDTYGYQVKKEDIPGKPDHKAHYVFVDKDDKKWGATHYIGHKTGSHLDKEKENWEAGGVDIEGRKLSDEKGCTQKIRRVTDQTIGVRPLKESEIAKIDPVSVETCCKMIDLIEKDPQKAKEIHTNIKKINTSKEHDKPEKLSMMGVEIDVAYEEKITNKK